MKIGEWKENRTGNWIHIFEQPDYYVRIERNEKQKGWMWTFFHNTLDSNGKLLRNPKSRSNGCTKMLSEAMRNAEEKMSDLYKKYNEDR